MKSQRIGTIEKARGTNLNEPTKEKKQSQNSILFLTVFISASTIEIKNHHLPNTSLLGESSRTPLQEIIARADLTKGTLDFRKGLLAFFSKSNQVKTEFFFKIASPILGKYYRKHNDQKSMCRTMQPANSKNTSAPAIKDNTKRQKLRVQLYRRALFRTIKDVITALGKDGKAKISLNRSVRPSNEKRGLQ